MSTKFQIQPQTSLVFTSDGPEFTRHSDHEGSNEVNESTNAFQDNTGKDQPCSVEFIFREFETDKLSPSDSTNEHDKRRMVSGDFLNDEASSDRKGGGGKNVSAGLCAETDTDQVVERVAGKEQINKHCSTEKASQSKSLKWETEMNSHEFPSNTLQGKDASSDFGDAVPVEKKTSDKKEPLLQNKTADVSVNNNFESKPSVSDKTVQIYLDAHEDKEKIKLSNDQNLPKDTPTSQVLRELSQDYLSMTDDGKLVHIKDAGLHVNPKQIDKFEPIKPAKPTIEDVAELGQGSSEMKNEEDSVETEPRTQSDILLSVLARAERTRPPVLQKSTAQEPKQGNGDDSVPTIVIIPSESPDPTELNGKWL